MDDIRSCPSLPALFLDRAARGGDRPVLSGRRGDRWETLSWREAADLGLALAAGLEVLGLAPGGRVALVSENRPEWAIADFAIMAAGGITVPAYTTNTPEDHRYIFDNSGAEIVIVSTVVLARRVLAAAAQARHRPQVVVIDPFPADEAEVIRWSALVEAGRGSAHAARLRERIRRIKRSDTACLIHTSGTGGAPKGVILSHGAILCNCHGASRLVDELGGPTAEHGQELFVSFLPLSHAYEHTAGLWLPISIGAHIVEVDSLDQLTGALTQWRPTIMTAVPRLYEVMRARIVKGVDGTGRLGRALFHAALDLGLRRLDGRAGGSFLRVADALLDRLVRRRVAERFGGRLKAFVSGGAPLPPDVGRFFLALGVTILQGYGQTEAGPVISANRPGRVRIDTVGPALEGVEMRIAPDGEILVRGELVMQGYWNESDATRAAIDSEGWLHTGDIGVIEADGSLRITDRKKDIIVSSGGDTISPQRIETLLTQQPGIAQAMVHGDRRPHLVALIVVDSEWAESWKPGGWRAHPELRDRIGEAVANVNKRLAPLERVRRFALIDEPFSLDNGQLTPTLKIRRHMIRDRHAERIDALYDERVAS